MRFRRALKKIVPLNARRRLRDAEQWLVALGWRGDAVCCTVCGGRFRAFMPFGVVKLREGARCPGCGAMERHRLIWRVLRERTQLFLRPHRVLHFAPERGFERQLQRAAGIDYLSVDLEPGRAMRSEDITALTFPDASFDVVLCSDVLEHVAEHRRALSELLRVLRPGGWALLHTPIDYTLAETYEDPAVQTDEQRARAYGHPEHLRQYGRDFPDLLRAAGFHVHADDLAFTLSPGELREQGIVPEPVYLAFRPGAG